MKVWLLKFTDFVLQWGGMLVGVMYPYQTWREFPITAKRAALPTFIKKMIIGFGSAFIGVATVVAVTLYFL